MIKICPRCQQRYIVDIGVTDYIHQCDSGNLALDQEDIVVIGDWVDWSGSGTKGPKDVLSQGAENTLFGTRADVEGEDDEDHTRRGVRASTRRQRQHFESIDKI